MVSTVHQHLYSAYPRYTPCSKRFTIHFLLVHNTQVTQRTRQQPVGRFYNICRRGQCCSSPGGPPSLTSVSDRTRKFVWNTFPKGIPSKRLFSFRTRGPPHKVNIEPSKLQLHHWRHWVVCVKCLTQGHNVWPEKNQQACHPSDHRHPSDYWARSLKLDLRKRRDAVTVFGNIKVRTGTE